MANTVKMKQSAVAGKVPTTAQLALGELAINTVDGKLFLKKNVSGTESIVDVTAAAAGVTSVAGKTGAVTLSVGDVSGAAPLASPALTGIPTAPTAGTSANNTQLATTAFVRSVMDSYGIGTTDLQDYSGDLNALYTSGIYLATGANTPVASTAFFVIVMTNNLTYTSQLATQMGGGGLYIRSRSDTGWSSWRQFASSDMNGIQSVNGIKFPASQSASSDANTLDDYEEGTWSPVCNNTAGTITYTASGDYTKIGRLVLVNMYIVINSVSATGGLGISNLPFPCVDSQGVVDGRENALTGYTANGLFGNGGTSGYLWMFNNGATAVSGYTYVLKCVYKTT